MTRVYKGKIKMLVREKDHDASKGERGCDVSKGKRYFGVSKVVWDCEANKCERNKDASE